MRDILLAEAYIEIRGRMTKLNADIAQTQKLVERKFAQMEKSIKPLEGGIRLLSTAMIGLGGAITGAVALVTRSAVQFDRMERSLKAVAGSTEEANKQLARYRETAKLPGLGLKEVVDAAIRLQSVGIEAQKSDRYIRAVGNALATVGKGRKELDGVILALSQMQAKGKIAGDDLRQMANWLPQIRRAMMDAFGTGSTEEITKMGISVEDFMEKVITELEKLPPVSGGISNAIENLRDSATQLAQALGAHLLPALIKIVDTIAAVVTKFNEWAKEHTTLTSVLMHFAAVLGPMLIAGGVFGLLLTQIGSIGQAVKVLGATFTWFAMHPAVLAAAAITTLIAGLALYIKKAKDADDVTRQLAKSQEELAEKSAPVREILKKRAEEEAAAIGKVISRLEKEKAMYEELIRLDQREMGGFRVRGQILSLEALESKILEIDETIDKYKGKLGKLSTGLEKLAEANKAVAGETDGAAKKTKAMAAALEDLKKAWEELPAFLKGEKAPTIPEIQAPIFAAGLGKIKEEAERAIGEATKAYQKRIKMGEPEVPFERIQEMEKGFAAMRERDLANQKQMAERGEQIKEDELQAAYDNQAAFWAWTEAELVAFNLMTEQKELERIQKEAEAYEKDKQAFIDAQADKVKALELFYAQQAKEREQWLKDAEKANDDLLDNWDDLVSQQGSFASQMQAAFERSATSMENSLARFFESFYYGMEEGKSAWEMFTQFLKEELIRAVAVETARGVIGLGRMVIGLSEGGISPGMLQPTTGASPGSFAFFQHGGIARQPTLAMIGEGSKPEAVVPLKGGKIPVDIRGGAGATIHMTNIIQFPNADPSNIDQATFERRFRNQITTTMRNMARDGTLNKAVMR